MKYILFASLLMILAACGNEKATEHHEETINETDITATHTENKEEKVQTISQEESSFSSPQKDYEILMSDYEEEKGYFSKENRETQKKEEPEIAKKTVEAAEKLVGTGWITEDGKKYLHFEFQEEVNPHYTLHEINYQQGWIEESPDGRLRFIQDSRDLSTVIAFKGNTFLSKNRYGHTYAVELLSDSKILFARRIGGGTIYNKTDMTEDEWIQMVESNGIDTGHGFKAF